MSAYLTRDPYFRTHTIHDVPGDVRERIASGAFRGPYAYAKYRRGRDDFGEGIKDASNTWVISFDDVIDEVPPGLSAVLERECERANETCFERMAAE